METYDSTLFIIDDSLECREHAAVLGRTIGLRCEQFSSAEQFLLQYVPPRWGCVLVNFRLRGMNGLELLCRLADLDPTLPVIFISAYVNVRITVQALKNGAYSVMEKPCNFDELSETVRSALEQNRRVQFVREQHTTRQARFDRLDAREREVMAMVLEGLPNKAIVGALNISPRTLNRIRANILQKMEANSVVGLAQMIAELRIGGAGDLETHEHKPSGPFYRLDRYKHGIPPAQGRIECLQHMVE